MDEKQKRMVGYMVILGGFLMVAGVFLDWTDGFGLARNGWDYFTEPDAAKVLDYTYAAAVFVTAGATSMIVGILKLVPSIEGKAGLALSAVAIVVSLVALIIGLLFYFELSDYFGGIEDVSIETGIWVCIAGGVIVLIESIVAIYLSRKDSAESS
ncbi:MAG: hypothetical protein Q4Q58_01730 [Thermoplasmata archaeon]|nr:hypothetical protein [Thermoplasmata archaeon]